MQLSVGQCPDGSPAHCTLVACYWVRLLIWDWGLRSCLLGHCYRAFTSPSKLLLSIQHSKPKAGNVLSEVKLYELSTVTAVGLSCSRRCLFVLVCVCVIVRYRSKRELQHLTPPSLSYPYMRALIDAKRLLVSCPSSLPQPLTSLFIASSCSSFHSSFTYNPPSSSSFSSASFSYQTADRGMARSQTLSRRLSQNDWLCNKSLAHWSTSGTRA